MNTQEKRFITAKPTLWVYVQIYSSNFCCSQLYYTGHGITNLTCFNKSLKHFPDRGPSVAAFKLDAGCLSSFSIFFVT